VDTAAVSYRIVDFLKTHPPFGAMSDIDLLALTTAGRVKFYEANDFILWQGEPHKVHVFVIQQGTVSLWDDSGERATLRDVRGAGDLLGIERFHGARSCLQSARAESDVLIYAFAEADFETLLAKYPHARSHVAAYGSVTAYQAADRRTDARDVFLHDLVGRKSVVSCVATDRISEVARRLLGSGSAAIVVLDTDHQALDVLTTDRLVEWVAGGGGDARQTVAGLLRGRPVTIGAGARVTDGVLAMAAANLDALALTTGPSGGHVHGIVTSRDLAPVFGDQPAWILNDIGVATEHRQLRDLNLRARAFVLRSLTGPASVDWLARFTCLVDAAIVGRLISFAGPRSLKGCWCFHDSAGREESLTMLAPQLVVIVDAERDRDDLVSAHAGVTGALGDCGYLVKEPVFGRLASVASLAEWQQRYREWIGDPVRTQMYRVRPLFDLRAVHGPRQLWEQVESVIAGAVDPDFLRVIANDCLATLPPLTFFQDAVIEETGEQSSTFRLEHSALRPLVDVGRVFGVAARTVFGRSTLERLALARALAPDHEAIFRDASETLRTVLWQQGRVGISQGTAGLELPPALLSRSDRHRLKSGFRSILRLIEFTADMTWLEAR
jgi:CBS domain-containing protein